MFYLNKIYHMFYNILCKVIIFIQYKIYVLEHINEFFMQTIDFSE
jgi:hypothetical protein